ncbi:MAG: chromate transporter [Actinomycetota bacterium]|nr:chromate transporter [Actinomycetota bacterium]
MTGCKLSINTKPWSGQTLNIMKKKLSLFWTFFKIGAFTFGGGYAMLPLIEREIVENKGWLSQEEMVDIFAISQSFPGAVAINSAIFIGKKICGYTGALFALLGTILPSFVIITIVAIIFERISDISFIKAAFKGISSAVVALLIVAAIRVGKTAIRDKSGILIFIIALVLLVIIKIHPVYVIIMGILSGLLIYFIKISNIKNK